MGNDETKEYLVGRLLSLGYQAVKGGTGVIVNLPMACSVIISSTDTNLKFEPRFGRMRRSLATLTMFAITLVSLFAFLIIPIIDKPTGVNERVFELGPFVILGLFLAHVLDIIRYIITERFIMTAQMLVEIHRRAPS